MKTTFRRHLRSSVKKYQRSVRKTLKGKLLMGLTLTDNIHKSMQKIKRSPKRHRTFVAVRETVRNTGRVIYGPAWDVGETVLNSIGRLFRRRRKRKRR